MMAGKKLLTVIPLTGKHQEFLHYKIARKVSDPKYVVIDLEFDNLPAAELAIER
ncbi:MAG: hypothetical protein ABIN97_16975 [Ginsengibacter sp.]